MGATSVRLNAAPAATFGWLVIDPFGSLCELRRIAAVTGEEVTLAPV